MKTNRASRPTHATVDVDGRVAEIVAVQLRNGTYLARERSPRDPKRYANTVQRDTREAALSDAIDFIKTHGSFWSRHPEL